MTLECNPTIRIIDPIPHVRVQGKQVYTRHGMQKNINYKTNKHATVTTTCFSKPKSSPRQWNTNTVVLHYHNSTLYVYIFLYKPLLALIPVVWRNSFLFEPDLPVFFFVVVSCDVWNSEKQSNNIIVSQPVARVADVWWCSICCLASLLLWTYQSFIYHSLSIIKQKQALAFSINLGKIG